MHALHVVNCLWTRARHRLSSPLGLETLHAAVFYLADDVLKKALCLWLRAPEFVDELRKLVVRYETIAILVNEWGEKCDPHERCIGAGACIRHTKNVMSK